MSPDPSPTPAGPLINDTTRGLLFVRATAAIRASGESGDYRPGKVDRTRLISRLVAGTSFDSMQGRAQVGTIVSQAVQAVQTARDMQSAPNTALHPARPGLDPSIPRGEEAYRYRVVVEAMGPDGRWHYAGLSIVDDPNSLSWQEATQRGIEDISSGDWPDSLPAITGTDIRPLAYRAFVVTAGQR